MPPERIELDAIINAYRMNSRTCPPMLYPALGASLLDAFYTYWKATQEAEKNLNNTIKKILDEFMKEHPDLKME